MRDQRTIAAFKDMWWPIVGLLLSVVLLQTGCLDWDQKTDDFDNSQWAADRARQDEGAGFEDRFDSGPGTDLPAPGGFWVTYRSSAEPGWIAAFLGQLSERDLFKLAEHTVELTINPSRGAAVEAVEVFVDGRLSVRAVALQSAGDEAVVTALPLDVRHLEEGIHDIAFRVLQDDGSVLEGEEEIRVLLNVTRLVAQDGHLLWLGTFEHGVAAYDLGTDPTDPSDDRYLAYGGIQVGLTAEDTRLWYEENPTAPGGHTTMSLALDPAGGLWIGTFNGGLTYMDFGGTPFERSDDRFAYFLPSEAMAFDGEDWVEDALSMFNHNSVTAIVPDGERGVWVGTFDGLFYLDHGGSPLDTSDDTWTHYGSYDRYDRNIAQIAVDSSGLVWLASYDLKDTANDWNTLTVLDPRDTPTSTADDRWGRFDVLTGVMPSKVFTMTLDVQGLVWVGTVDGLYVLDTNGTPFDPSDDAFARRGVESGLPVDDIGAILPRADGTVWVGSFELCGETGGGLTLLDLAGATYGHEQPDAPEIDVTICDQGDTLERRECGALTPEADEFVVDYTRDDGLIDSDVSSIVEIDDRTVAIGTFNLLAAPALTELMSSLADTDIDGSICEPVEGPEGNSDLQPVPDPVMIGADGLSIIYLGEDLRDKSDDVVINL